MKGFLWCKGHTWAETIEKSNKNYQVWSHEGSTFFKKCHILAKIPVLGKLTHMFDWDKNSWMCIETEGKFF